MKFTLVFLMFINLLISYEQESDNQSCTSKVDTLTNLLVYEIVDETPSVKGGMQELFKEISKRIKYPHVENYPIETKVFVAFIVTHDGRIVGRRVIKNISGTDLAEQLLEIIGDFEWNPGICNGKPVTTIQILPMIINVK